jgi:tRNA wybutosine-synthesizing protein 4
MLAPRLGGSRLGDQAVVDTNDDAQLSKLSCVRHGYFQDAFVHHFVRRPTRRSPLINRGAARFAVASPGPARASYLRRR